MDKYNELKFCTMNGKVKLMIPAFAAVFALMFVFATPSVMADGSNYAKWGEDHHKQMKIQLGELSGSEPVTRDNIHDKKDQVISLSDATSNYPDAKKANLGVAVNDAGDKFLVWEIMTMTQNDDGTKSVTINVVDALQGFEITTIEKSFDRSSMDGKWPHHDMKGKFADLTPEERQAKFAQFQEIKQAFSSISDDDRETIMNHFKDMRHEFATLSDEEKDARHAEFKSHMEEFTNMSLDEKIAHLEDLAASLR